MVLIPLLLLAPSLFDYNHSIPFDVQERSDEVHGVVRVRDINFASVGGGRTNAYLVEPVKAGAPGPAVLFVHWYEPEAADSNRTQFLTQAEELARLGVKSLLVETMWSEPSWFKTRNRKDDLVNSVRQVKELQRDLDFLLTQPHIDPRRVAYVGHDFGMMFGLVLTGIDARIRVGAYQAGTSSFSDWYLLGTSLEEGERRAILSQLAEIDPLNYGAKIATSTTILLQFGRNDRYVPEAKAKEISGSLKCSKLVLWYDAGHGLNESAVRDRQQWLKEKLSLK